MRTYDIIKALRSYCITNDITFIPALTEDYINAVISRQYYEYNGLILVAMLNRQLRREGSNVIGVTFSGVIGLGQKRETVEVEEVVVSQTESSLDESFEQKYDRRLSELMFGLQDIIGEFVCAEELEVLNENTRMEINKFDLNADFVFTDISLAK